jgi:acetoacetyl-CoA synthetase
MTQNPLWTPPLTRSERSNLACFMAGLTKKHGISLQTYAEMHDFSVAKPEIFWAELWDYAKVKVSAKGNQVIASGAKMRQRRFFPEARLNYAENMLVKSDDTPALVFRGEDKVRKAMAWRELTAQVGQFARGLEGLGIKAGDRVCAVVPNMPETIVALLGCAAIGAIWSSCSPDFGERGILDRFGQIAPRILLCCNGYFL